MTLLDTIAAKYENLAADISQFNRDVAELLLSAGITDTDVCLVPDALASSNDTAKKLGFISKVVFNVAGQAARGMELFDRRKSTVRDEDELRTLLTKYFDDISM